MLTTKLVSAQDEEGIQNRGWMTSHRVRSFRLLASVTSQPSRVITMCTSPSARSAKPASQ